MFCLLSEAGRDLSAREMVVLSKFKVTEEPFVCARIPENKRMKLLFYLYILTPKKSGTFFSLLTVKRMSTSETEVGYKN